MKILYGTVIAFIEPVKRILIVDNELLILWIMAKSLRKDGIEVKTVLYGGDAIIEAQTCFYDLCFLDICLLDINGLEVMKQIKEASPDTKIVIMTGGHVTEGMKREIEERAYYFLPKPFDLTRIREIVDLACGEPGKSRPEGDMKIPEEERRRFRRRPLVNARQYVIWTEREASGTFIHNADILDISDGGVCILTDCSPPEGHMLVFSNGVEDRIGSVRWVKPFEADRYRVGVEFMQGPSGKS